MREVTGSILQLAERRGVASHDRVDRSERRVDVHGQCIGYLIGHKAAFGSTFDQRTEVVPVSVEVVPRLGDHLLVTRCLAQRVVDEEADVRSPQLEEGLLGLGAVNRADRAGQGLGVVIESSGRSLEGSILEIPTGLDGREYRQACVVLVPARRDVRSRVSSVAGLSTLGASSTCAT